MFKHILLATDGSANALKAAKTAADIAAKYGAKLTLLTVLPSSLSLHEVAAMPQAKRFSKGVKDEIKRMREAMAHAGVGTELPAFIEVPAPTVAIAEIGDMVLNEAEKIANAQGLKNADRLTVGGHPASAIADNAKKLRADLIVMGTRGLSDLKGIFVGSTSHKVLHLVSCPCLFVH